MIVQGDGQRIPANFSPIIHVIGQSARICELLVSFDLPSRMIRPFAQGASARPSISFGSFP